MLLIPAFLLLSGGIAMLRRKPKARSLHLAYAWVTMIFVIPGIVYAGPQGQRFWDSLLPLIYPVFILIWFYRKNIRQQARQWSENKGKNIATS